MRIDAQVDQWVLFLSLVHEQVGRAFRQRPCEPLLAARSAASLKRPHETLRQIIGRARRKRRPHGCKNSFAPQHVAKCGEAVARAMPRPAPCLAARVAGDVAATIDQRHLSVLEVRVGAAQQVENLCRRMAEAQESESERLQRRIDEGLRCHHPDVGRNGRTLAAHRQRVGGKPDTQGTRPWAACEQGVGHASISRRLDRHAGRMAGWVRAQASQLA